MTRRNPASRAPLGLTPQTAGRAEPRQSGAAQRFAGGLSQPMRFPPSAMVMPPRPGLSRNYPGIPTVPPAPSGSLQRSASWGVS